MKKYLKMTLLILLIVSTIMTLLTGSSFASSGYSDIPKDAYYENAVNNLTRLKVIEGDGNGLFRPKSNVTRAEFIKMMIVALGKEEEAIASSWATAFSDISSDYWANGYINVAVKENLIMGYSDGTFKPEERINQAQVVTILLRALGYDSTKMSGVWPQNYIDKAKSLGITDGIEKSADSIVNRANAALMLDRTLNTEMISTTKTLIEQSVTGTVKTAIITNSYDVDSTLPTGLIKTDSGDYMSNNFSGLDYLGKKVDLLIDSNNNILLIQKVEKDSHVIFANGISNNVISYTDKNGDDTITLPDNLIFYYNGTKSTFSNIKQNISVGSIIALAEGEISTSIEYGVLTGPETSEPVVTIKDVEMDDNNIGAINIANRDAFVVIRNGEKATFSDIKMNDVVYLITNPFKQNSSILLVYDNKISGTYDEALPSKNAVSKINLQGTEYEIETSQATSKLNDSKAAFQIDDEITILTGKDGKIVDVISPSSVGVTNYAIVINTRESLLPLSNSDDNTFYYVKLFCTDGTTHEYMTDKDKSSLKSRVVKYYIKDNIAYITECSYSSVSGFVDKNEKMIGSSWLSSDVAILDMDTDVDEDEDVKVKTVTIRELPTSLKTDNVIDAEKGGDFDDIQLLVLNNVTGIGDVGILSSKSIRQNENYRTVDGERELYVTTSATYTILIDGTTKTYNYTFLEDEKPFKVEQGDIVLIKLNGDALDDLSKITPLDKGTEIQGIDYRRIKINDHIYRLASDVQVYNLSGQTPVATSTLSLSTGKVNYVAVYAGNSTNTVSIITYIKN